MEEPTVIRPLWLHYGMLGLRANETFFQTLRRYRGEPERVQTTNDALATLTSSRTVDGTHLPIIDLDSPHRYVVSSTPGHGHLYIDKPISHRKWQVLQVVLWLCGVQEKGYTFWSLRRGANFVRVSPTKYAEKFVPLEPTSQEMRTRWQRFWDSRVRAASDDGLSDY